MARAREGILDLIEGMGDFHQGIAENSKTRSTSDPHPSLSFLLLTMGIRSLSISSRFAVGIESPQCRAGHFVMILLLLVRGRGGS